MTIDTKALRERFITEVERFGQYYCVDYFADWSVEYDWIDPEYPTAEIKLELMAGESRTVPLCLFDRDELGIDIGDAGTLDADGYGLMSYLWNEAEQQNRKDADRLAALEAENERLREALSDYYHQHKCGCGHPACKRCRDDRHVEEALAAGGEKC